MTLTALPAELYSLGIAFSCRVFVAFRVKTDLMRFYFSGYKQKSGASKENFNDTCEICSPGTYGGHPNRSTCEPCRGGVVCLEGETFRLLLTLYVSFLQ